jgi:hypothetical protein
VSQLCRPAYFAAVCFLLSFLQVVSQVENATGKVVLLPDLLGVQGVAFDQPTVVLAQALGGMEDIPDGVVAVLTRSSTDVLSHVAIRARTQGVLLAGCSDEEEWRHLVELEVRCNKFNVLFGLCWVRELMRCMLCRYLVELGAR